MGCPSEMASHGHPRNFNSFAFQAAICRLAISIPNDEVCRRGARLRGYRYRAIAAWKEAEEKMPGTRGSAMALVQYPQITGDGLGDALRPPLRWGVAKWKNASGNGPGGTMNREWHEGHKMPARATANERIEWHLAHSKSCGCRPFPKKLAEKMSEEEKRELDAGGRSVQGGSRGELRAMPGFLS